MSKSIGTALPLTVAIALLAWLFYGPDDGLTRAVETLSPSVAANVNVQSDGIGALPSRDPEAARLPVGSAPPSTSVEASTPGVADASVVSTLAYTQEIARLNRRITWLETELDLCGSEVTQGPVGRWLTTLQPGERPSSKTLHLVADYVRPYPVELLAHEGLWMAERIEKDDWKDWGPTIDEAIILYLGVARLERDLSLPVFAALKEEWEDSGIF